MRIPLMLLLTASLFAQIAPPPEKHLVKQAVFNAIAQEFSGEAAQEHTRHIVQYHRIQGSPMMEDVAKEVVLPALKAAGLEAAIEQFPSDGKTKYQTYISPMGWDMRGGELWVEGVEGQKDFQPVRLCRYSDVPMCVSTYSKGGDWSGELVDVNAGTSDADFAGKDVSGKVALAYGYAANVVREAVIKHGAVGVVIYPRPGDRPDHPDMVRYNGIWPRAEEMEKTSGGFQISQNQYTMLKQLMRGGAVRVHGKIDATLKPYLLTVVHAWIRGNKDPQREVLLTAHLDHPKWSANDNASGSGAMIEIARTLNALIKSGKLPAPERTIHFMWVPEFFGSVAYITKHPEARRCGDWDDPRQAKDYKWKESDACIVANLNLDMVGEDTVKTNSRFYVTRTPDSVPSFLDALLADSMQQTREANLTAPTGSRHYWAPEQIGYAQGSDHDVFNALGVPSSMFGHDPDWTHHTSEDTIDKTDVTEFKRVGVMAGAAAWWFGVTGKNEIDALELALSSYKQRPNESPTRLIEQMEIFMSSTIPTIGTEKEKIEIARGMDKSPIYHRLTLASTDGSAFESLPAEDKKWLSEQSTRFPGGSDGNGISSEVDMGLLTFETINFMNGKRSTKEIALLLSAEFLVDIDEAWVNRMVGILEKQGLVTTK